MISYLVDNIDKGLNLVTSETSCQIGHLSIREDHFNKGGNLALRDGTVDQALEGLIMGVKNGGWIRGEVHIPRQIRTR